MLSASVLVTATDPHRLCPQCEHSNAHAKLRVKLTSNGVKQFRFQCQVCGEKGEIIGHKNHIVAGLISDPPPIDDEIRNRWWDQKRVGWEQERQSEQNERRRQYSEYMRSPEWKARRLRVLNRDEHRCQAAMDGCLTRATEVHHLTYDHIFDEPIFELVAVCFRCHEQITEADRRKRASA